MRQSIQTICRRLASAGVALAAVFGGPAAAQETIKVLHSPKFMRDARAVESSISDNPLHRELCRRDCPKGLSDVC